MKHAPPQPPELGSLDGLAYALFLPDGEPRAGVVILHGGGSTKEGHFDYARLCREAGMAALAYDARGHGRSDGPLGASSIEDALAMCDLIREYAPRVSLRGSSMGGCVAIHAASRDADIAGVVAICPAPEDLLMRALRSGELPGIEADRDALEPFLESLDLYSAVARLGPATALLLLHARGDEQVPYTVSEQLHAAAHEPKRLILFPGGHHRSLQHDVEVQNLSLRFLAEAAARGV